MDIGQSDSQSKDEEDDRPELSSQDPLKLPSKKSSMPDAKRRGSVGNDEAVASLSYLIVDDDVRASLPTNHHGSTNEDGEEEPSELGLSKARSEGPEDAVMDRSEALSKPSPRANGSSSGSRAGRRNRSSPIPIRSRIVKEPVKPPFWRPNGVSFY